MSNKKQKETDNEMSENSVNEILFAEDTQSKPKKSKRLTTSSTQEAGTGSPGETRMINPTPPDATGYVRTSPEGKLRIDTKAVALENKALKTSMGVLRGERDSLYDELVSLRSQLEKSKNPGSHPVPSPAKDLSITDGLEGALSKSQFDTMLTFIGEQVRIYQDSQAAAKSGKEIVSTTPLDPEAPGPSRVASPHIGLADKSSAKSSHKDMMGSSLGDGSEDDMDDGTLSMDVGAYEDVIG